MKSKSLLGVVALTAVVGAWVPVGPVKVPVMCGDESPSNPDVMYVVVVRNHTQNLMRSGDRGLSWASANDSLSFQPRVLLVNPTDAATLYAVSGRVHRSTDSGVTWVDLPTPPGLWFGLLADPTRPQLLLAVGCSPAGGGDRAALCRSTDDGATWRLVWCDTTVGSCGYSVAVDPSDTSTIYCGGFARGHVFCYKTTDGGSVWSSRDVGVTGYGPAPDSAGLDSYPFESPGTKCPGALLVSPSDRNTVLIGTRGSGLYRSTDGGSNWSGIGFTQLAYTYTLAVARRTTEVVYAGCEDEVVHSVNGGQSWEVWWGGAYGKRQRCVLVPADSSGVVYCGNDAGFFRGTAPGRYWNILQMFVHPVISAIAFSESAPHVAYAAMTEGGVYRSTDSGGAWTGCQRSPGSGSICGLASPAARQVWAVTAGDSGRASVAISGDLGNTWQVADTSFERGGAIAASRPGFVAATGMARDSLGRERFAIAISVDHGTAWRRSLLCTGGFGRSATVSPAAPNWLLVGGDSAGSAVIYSTRDTGRSWQRLDSGVVGRVSSVLFCPWSGGPLVCGTTQGVYWSDNGGVSWTYSGLGQVRAIVGDAYRQQVYAGTRTGVYGSDVRSGQWFDFNSGLANPDVLCLAVSSDTGGYQTPVLAGTNQSGLFREWLYHVDVSENPAVVSPTSSELAVQPNPFHGRTYIILPTMSVLTSVEVFDPTGRRVATLSGRFAAGKGTWDWDARGFPAGTYFVRAGCGGSAAVCRAVLLE